MFNTLRMQFGGIVCFALSADQGVVKNVLALLADGRHPASGHHGGHHPPHVAVLQFYTDQLSPGNELKPDLYFRRPGSNREQGLLFLVREDLELEGTESNPPPIIVGGRTNDDAPANTVEERDFYWVADCARLGVSGLKAGCVDKTLGAPENLLARFTLRGGVLSTGGVEKFGGAPIQATFLDDSNPPLALSTYSQALALWSDWDVSVGPTEVTILLTSFDTGMQRRLVLSCEGLPIGGSIWASVKNVTMADLFELSEVIEPGTSPGMRGSHFDLHYGLVDPFPAPAWVPDPATVTDGKPLCPPTKIVVGRGT